MRERLAQINCTMTLFKLKFDLPKTADDYIIDFGEMVLMMAGSKEIKGSN